MFISNQTTLKVIGAALLINLTPIISYGACESLFTTTSKNSPTSLSWRSKFTQPNSTKGFSASNVNREKLVEKKVEAMKKEILNDGRYPKLNGGQPDTPEMDFFQAGDMNSYNHDYIVKPGGYGSGVIPKIQITGIGSSGILNATFLLPVSGHTGIPNALRWAKTDTYSLEAMYPDGKKTLIINNGKSLDLITAHEVKIPLVKGKDVKIFYDRSGSGGPGGYTEGRILILNWDGK